MAKMKHMIFMLALLLTCNTITASELTSLGQVRTEQRVKTRSTKSNGTTSGKKASEIYRSVEQMPRYPGGEAALMKYLGANIRYPEDAAKNNIEGRVVLQFVVEADGSIGEVKVVRSVDPSLDAEAVRVIKSIPKFTPGRHDGKAVAVWYTIPVSFQLTHEEDSDINQ